MDDPFLSKMNYISFNENFQSILVVVNHGLSIKLSSHAFSLDRDAVTDDIEQLRLNDSCANEEEASI